MTNPWPGNVRELRATIELLAAMSENDMITVADLSPHLLPEDGPENIVEKDRPLKEAVEDLERRLITNALIKGRSTYKAARLLKMSQSSIVRKAQKYKIGIAQVAHEG
jgi:transcriptional regulator with PAS, ATPase and Fis domain